MTRTAKSATTDALASHFKNADAIITGYRGLTTAQLRQLRTALRGNATLTVTKNTLARQAAEHAGLDLAGLLTGPTAIAFVSGDTALAALALAGFARENPALSVRGGVTGSQVVTPDEIGRLEPRAVLLARLAGAMTAKTTQLARLADALRARNEDDHGEAE